MRDFPSCFGEHGVQVADSFANAGRGTQNVVTCFYRVKLAGVVRVITVNWCKTLRGQGLSVNVDDVSPECTCKVDMKPWLFWKKKGSKVLEVGEHRVEVLWDLTAAKYGSGPEPTEGFYLAVVAANEIVLLLGSMLQEACKRALPSAPPSLSSEASLISRREHIFGKTTYATKAQLGDSGRAHDISIECQVGGKEPRLSVRVDEQLVVQVKRLMWKFRGNQTIIVDGFPVELLWDVHNWLFNPSDNHAVFMFQASLPPSNNGTHTSGSSRSKAMLTSATSLLQWRNQLAGNCTGKDGDGGSNCTDKDGDGGNGFSLLLYAWKSE